MEFTSVSAVALVVYLFLNAVGVLPDVYSVGDIIIGGLVMDSLGIAGGLLIAGATEAGELPEKFIAPLQYLMLPFSGCFFMLGWPPSYTRDFLQYVPFVHAFETIRAGYFSPSVLTYGNPTYGFAWGLGLTGCGLLLISMVRDRIAP